MDFYFDQSQILSQIEQFDKNTTLYDFLDTNEKQKKVGKM